LIKLVRTKQH